jgi:hypothetical protein
VRKTTRSNNGPMRVELFSARNESGDITQKYLEILQERQQYNRDIEEITRVTDIQ